MARHTLESVNPAGLRFSVAAPEDDADIRRLLRECPMNGAVQLTIEREPNYFEAIERERCDHQTLICRNAAGQLLGIGARTVRPMLFNAQPARVAYLSQFRLAPGLGSHRRMIAAGYAALLQSNDSDLTLTTIMSDNMPARRLLEAGVSGLPAYSHLVGFSTFILRPGNRVHRLDADVRRAPSDEWPAVIQFLNAQAGSFALAPIWECDEARLAANEGRLTLYRASYRERIVACLGRMDSREVSQVRVRGYAPHLRLTRPIINLAAKALGWPTLPVTGRVLPMQYVSHLAATPEGVPLVPALLSLAITDARQSGCCLIGGLCDTNPLVPAMDRQKVLRLRSRVYAVECGGRPNSPHVLAGQPMHLEVSQL